MKYYFFKKFAVLLAFSLIGKQSFSQKLKDYIPLPKFNENE